MTPISTPKQPVRTERIAVPGGRKPLLRLHVDAGHPTTLLAFLIEALPDKSRTTVKQLLHDRFIAIGTEPTTQFDAPSSLAIPLISILLLYRRRLRISRSRSSTKMSTYWSFTRRLVCLR